MKKALRFEDLHDGMKMYDSITKEVVVCRNPQRDLGNKRCYQYDIDWSGCGPKEFKEWFEDGRFFKLEDAE